MKVYFAARYSRREELVGYRRELALVMQSSRYFGIDVNSRWLNGNHQIPDDTSGVEAEAQAAQFAMEDWLDVREADMVVCFTEEPRTGPTRGGRHVEFGMAYALNKKLLIVGPRENVFYHLPGVTAVDTWEEAKEILIAQEDPRKRRPEDLRPVTAKAIADDLFFKAFGRKP